MTDPSGGRDCTVRLSRQNPNTSPTVEVLVDETSLKGVPRSLYGVSAQGKEGVTVDTKGTVYRCRVRPVPGDLCTDDFWVVLGQSERVRPKGQDIYI